MSGDERPIADVPAIIWAALGLALAAQIAWRSASPPPAMAAADLPPAPSVASLRLAALGEPEALARLSMLYLQAYDYGGANTTSYSRLDYGRLVAWLDAILALDPRSDYPLFAASRVYAENPDPARTRLALEFVYRQFLAAPDRRWASLAQAALIAKHRLKDLPLARRYAAAIDRYTRSPDVPLWARQMEVFILEDMDELEAARIVLGGMLASGNIKDPQEARFLARRLKELEERARSRSR
jgi:hypothetical protein